MKPEKHLKKIVSRICGGGILSIASLSLVGVGFSSWLITGKDNPTRDNPLDSIGADGDFSDINNYLKIDSIDTSKLSWNDTKKTFNTPNNEIIANNNGYLYVFFSRDTGDDLIKDHLISSRSTFKIVLDFEKKDQSASGNPISTFSNLITDRKLIGSSSALSSSAKFDSGIAGTKADGNWQGTFSVDESTLNSFSTCKKYSFGVRYTFNPTNSNISYPSTTSRIASVHVEY